MRVTVMAEFSLKFQKGRYGGDSFIKSIGALKNFVQ